MKHYLAILLATFIANATFCQSSVDSMTIRNIDGANVSLMQYHGKKMLFMIMPSRLADSSRLDEIASFNAQYGDSIKLVGIFSKEDGYVDSNKAELKALYQSKGVNILLTEGMFTKKSAGANQSALMKFFTTRSLNKRFDDDAGGAGHKFFVNEEGRLFAVLIPQASLFSPAVMRNLARQL